MNLDEYRELKKETKEKERLLAENERLGAASSKSRKKRTKVLMIYMLIFGALLGVLLSFLGNLAYRHIPKKNKEVKKIIINTQTGEIKDLNGEEISVEEALESGQLEVVSANEVDDTVSNPSVLETLQNSLTSGEGTLRSLRKVFKDQILVTSGSQFYFFPIDDNKAKHNYSDDGIIINDDGSFSYEKEDKTMAKKGVDISRYQGDVQWDKVKEAGIDFAIIRCGIRGYESGEIVVDEGFWDNAVSASQQGIEIGVYFFSQAITKQEAVEEADVVIESLSGNEIAYPVVYDLERISGGRMQNLTKDEMTDNCLAFCNRIKEAGYTPMIYGNLETFMLMLDIDRLDSIEKWLAYYNNDFYYPYEFSMWQYSETGQVDGIEGEVDMDLDLR